MGGCPSQSFCNLDFDDEDFCRQALKGIWILQPHSFGEVYPEPVAAALVAAGHLGRSLAELLLNKALVDSGRRGQSGA